MALFKKKWLILFALALPLIMIFIDQTALAVALPSITQSFSLVSGHVDWVVTLYLLGIAATILVAGKIGDQVGQLHSFLFGLVCFVIFSLLCSLSGSFYQLLLFRLGQGISAAFMMPSSAVLLVSAFPPQERGKAMGFYFMITTVFLAVGPLLGGLLIKYASWHWVFLINLPIGLTSLALLCCIFSAQLKDIQLREFSGIDWLAAVYSSIAITSLSYSFMLLGSDELAPMHIVAFVVVFFVAALLCYRRSRGGHNPLIDRGFFQNKTVCRCVFIISTMQIGLVCLVFWPMYLQDSLGLSASQSGLIMLVLYVPLVLTGPMAGKLYDNFGPRLPASRGMFGLALGFIWVALSASSHNLFLLLPGLLITGMSVPLVVSSLMVSVVIYSESMYRGVASGVANACRQIGGLFGMALIGSVISFSAKSSFSIVSSHSFSIGMLLAGIVILCAASLALALPSKQQSDLELVLDKNMGS